MKRLVSNNNSTSNDLRLRMTNVSSNMLGNKRSFVASDVTNRTITTWVLPKLNLEKYFFNAINLLLSNSYYMRRLLWILSFSQLLVKCIFLINTDSIY